MERDQPADLGARRVHPKRRCCTYLCFYKFIRAVGVLSCLLVALLNLFALVDQTGDSGKGDAVAKIAAVGHLGFLILIAVVLCLAFFELGFVMTWLQVLDTWFGLGGTLLFLAFSTLDKANGQDTNYDSRMKLAVQVMCYILVSVGALFMILGCCGGKRQRNRWSCLSLSFAFLILVLECSAQHLEQLRRDQQEAALMDV